MGLEEPTREPVDVRRCVGAAESFDVVAVSNVFSGFLLYYDQTGALVAIAEWGDVIGACCGDQGAYDELWSGRVIQGCTWVEP